MRKTIGIWMLLMAMLATGIAGCAPEQTTDAQPPAQSTADTMPHPPTDQQDTDTPPAIQSAAEPAEEKAFSPEEFAQQLEADTGERVVFWDKVFSNEIYLYFVPITLPSATFHVYYTASYQQTLERLEIILPGDVIFEEAVPIYMGGGGGSGECQFILALRNGDDLSYASYDNFHYTDGSDLLDFQYRELISHEQIQQMRQDYPWDFHDSTQN